MSKFAPAIVLLVLLMIASLACSQSVTATADPGFINTVVAQTLTSIPAQDTQPPIPVTVSDQTSTFTPESPASSPTITPSPTLAFSATPLIPLISVSVDTNCRVGPGKAYDRTGALLVGEIAEVYGRDPTGKYWYVRNPDHPDDFCWLWGEYATLVGNVQALPIYTPPPTPTPAPVFEAKYSSLDSCVGWWVKIRLKNTGGITFKSMSLTVRDETTGIVLSVDSNGFTNIDGCSTSNTKETLTPAEKLFISSPPFAYDPAGHDLRATITLCTDTSQSGACVTNVINFKP